MVKNTKKDLTMIDVLIMLSESPTVEVEVNKKGKIETIIGKL